MVCQDNMQKKLVLIKIKMLILNNLKMIKNIFNHPNCNLFENYSLLSKILKMASSYNKLIQIQIKNLDLNTKLITFHKKY